MHEFRGFQLLRMLPVVALCTHAAGAQVLRNTHLRVAFGARGLASITDLSSARTDRLLSDDAAVTIGADTFDTRTLAAPSREVRRNEVIYHYRTGTYRFDVMYELKPGWSFVGKQLSVTALVARKFTVGDVTLFRTALADTPVGVVRPMSARPSLGTFEYGAALRFANGRSLLMIAQNPFLHATVDGNVASLRYAPDMEWSGGDGAYVSDRGMLAPVRLSGRVLPQTMTPEWQTVAQGAPGLDEAEVAAFTGMVRSLFIYEPAAPLNVFVGWCVNDYQIDAGTAEGVTDLPSSLDVLGCVA